MRLIIGILLFFASFFPITFPEYSNSLISAISIVLLALPGYYFFIKKENSKAIFTLLAISFFAIIIESIGVITGFPYSPFFYNDQIGIKLFNVTPWTVFFAFTPLVIGAVYYSSKLIQKIRVSEKNKIILFFLVSTALLVLTDLILDPVAVKLNFWTWINPGFYYNIPLQNYFGWVLAGLLSTAIYYYFNKTKIVEGQEISLYYSIWFWTGASLFLELYIPFFIGIILIVFFHKFNSIL